ncbi:AMP-binding protein [Streptosporangium sp. NPDC049644]|uniref:AMP-binding protein n=1 Tax=Streptosporangium sp. NPDC049644 TaxID=3155507 RepID=UPI003432D49B
MTWDPIPKSRQQADGANLTDYERERREFSWRAARRSLRGLPGGRGLNIAYEAVDRHLDTPRCDQVALRCVGRDDTVTELTYRDMHLATNRFAGVLRGLGVGRGERVFTLLGRVPDLYVAVLGTLKNLSVLSPLFSAFGPEPIRERLRLGDGRVLVTTPELYTRKIAAIRESLPALKHVLLTGHGPAPEGTLSLGELLAGAPAGFEIVPTDPEDMALLHFTSGTTGRPKGVVHVHEAVLAHRVTAAYALDLRPSDVFWCTADPGWVTGMSYGVIAPLSLGLTLVTDAGEFDARRWYRVLQDQRVNVWYTSPTALRMLMRHGGAPACEYDLSGLRFVASVGEPLNPEVAVWGLHTLGLPVHDNWWQTETGAIMIGNFAATDIKPGSMGRPLPGIAAAVLERGEDGRARVVDGHVRVIEEPGAEGEPPCAPAGPRCSAAT